MPEPVSVPDHPTVKLLELCVAASEPTRLDGLELSIVLSHSGVSIGALVSKMMLARLRISAPVAIPSLGHTVKSTCPSPSGAVTFGGRKPAVGSSVGSPVAGSSEVKRHVSRPLVLFS